MEVVEVGRGGNQCRIGYSFKTLTATQMITARADMQPQPQHSAHADPEIFTDGWDPRQWQQEQKNMVQQQQQASLSAPLLPQLPQLYRPALLPPSSHNAFAAAVVAAGRKQIFKREIFIPRQPQTPILSQISTVNTKC